VTHRVQLFAVAKQLAGRETIEISLADHATVADLRRALAAAVPELADSLPRMLFAVNQEYARDTTPIPPDAEVACIPPVSGG
jgi:molybdopterin converting factor subunit 1